MKEFIACLLLVALLGMIPPLLPAQQNQSAQKSDPEIEALKKRVSELEKELQTVENVEKMDLQAKLAEANTKLINAGVDKYKWELRDSNDKWLRNWGIFFLGFLSVVGVGIWSWVKRRTNQLIANTVEKNLNGFKEALKELDILKNQQRVLKTEADIFEKSFKETVDQLDILKNQLGVVEKAHAASMLEDFYYLSLHEEHDHPEQIKALSEEALLQVFEDANYRLELRYRAAKVLTVRKSPRLVSSLLKFLNLVLDSDSDINFTTESLMRGFVDLLGHIYTQEAYQGLKKFLNRLLTEDPKHKDLFLMWTVLSLTWVSVELNIRDSVSIVREAMSHFQHPGNKDLSVLVKSFDRFNEPAGIKEILTQHVTDGMTDVENRCLELLQKHDPEFVAEWRARKTTDNSD